MWHMAHQYISHLTIPWRPIQHASTAWLKRVAPQLLVHNLHVYGVLPMDARAQPDDRGQIQLKFFGVQIYASSIKQGSWLSFKPR